MQRALARACAATEPGLPSRWGTDRGSLSRTEKTPVCRISEADTGRLVRSFPLPVGGSSTIAWSPDGATLAIAGDDSKIYLWDAETGTRKLTLEGSTEHGISTAFHPAGTVLASNSWESRLPAVGPSTWADPC